MVSLKTNIEVHCEEKPNKRKQITSSSSRVIQEGKLTQNVPSELLWKQTGKSYGITHPAFYL